MTMTKRRLSSLGAATFLILSGCGESVEPLEDGALALSWQVSPRGCESAGVVDVVATLDGPRGTVKTFSCSDGTAEVHDLVPGRYDVTLEGLDERGQTIFESARESTQVHADGMARTPHIRLTAKPATFAVGWRFQDGRVCGAHAVESIDIRVFDKSDFELGQATFDCNDGVGDIGGFTAGDYVVEAVAQSDSGEIFTGVATTFADRGQTVDVEVTLAAE